VIHIGTNNLGSGELPAPTAEGIISVSKYVLENTVGRVVIVQVLPRGDGKEVLPTLCPPRCRDSKNGVKAPFKSFLPAVDMVNAKLQKHHLGTDLPHEYKGRFSLLDCGSPFLLDDDDDEGEEVNITLMPDRLHPNVNGQRLLLQCVIDCIHRKTC